MKMKSTLVVLALVFGLISCSKNTEKVQPSQTTTSQTALKSTSADGQIHLFIRGVDNTQFVAGGGTLTRVELVQKGNSKFGAKKKRVTIYDGTKVGNEDFNDLLDMNSGIMLDLSDGTINPPPGNYDFAVATVLPGSGWIKDTNGVTYPVKFPGNKFILAFKPAITITTEISLDVVLDIDVSHSFVKTGKSYIFKPVVKVVNATTTGTLAGGTVDATTYQPITGVTVYVLVDGMPYGTQSLDQPYTDSITGQTINPGEYYLPFIPAGTYTAYVEKAGYTSTQAQVTINAGNFTFENFFLTPQ